MASTTISSAKRSSTTSRNKKKRKTNQNQHEITSNNTSILSWKSESQQQAYSTKLLQALHHLHINPPPASTPKGGRLVRQAADQALAVAAKGRTRWSRAILTNKLKLKFLKKNSNRKVQRASSNIVTGNNKRSLLKQKGSCGILRLKTRNLPAVQRRVKVLGKLVPGCRKEALPVVLEEAGDYIAALEMQVRAMTAITELLSGSRAGGSTPEPPPHSISSD